MVGGDYRRNHVLACAHPFRVPRSLQPGDQSSGGFFRDSVVDTFYIFFSDRAERLRSNFCEFCPKIALDESAGFWRWVACRPEDAYFTSSSA
jgi:hypothetical protein